MGLFKSLFGGNNTPETEKEKNDKKNFEILKYDGIRAQRMGKLPYAIKCFEEAVAINDELETLSLLATAYTQANRLDDARITLDRMATKDPEQVNTFLSLAGICYMQEDYENMKDACQKALVLDNKNPLSFYLTAKAAIGLKGEILAATNEPEQAQECFNQVLSLNPFNEKAYILSGELYLVNKDFDKALAVYDEAIEINPNFAKAYHERGRIKLLKGDKDGSVEDMKKAIELAPENEMNISGQYNNYENMTKNVPF